MITEPGNLLLRDDPLAPVAPTSMPPTVQEAIDPYLDTILRASGSALKHYTTQKTLDHMRAAMNAALEAAKAEGIRMGLEAARKIQRLSAEQIFAIRDSIRPGDGWDGDDWDIALTQAVENTIRFAIRAIDIEEVLKRNEQ